jgi:uncharacterized protein (TIGR02246 family)
MKLATHPEAIVQEFGARWNRHDAAGLAALFAVETDLINAFGVAVKGREAIERFHTALFKSVFAGASFHIEATAIRFIRPDVAQVDVRWGVTGMPSPDEQPRPDLHGLMAIVMTDDDGEWRIATMHVMQFPSEPPPAL